MFANALAQVEPPSTGIHLIWSGPRSWVYSPGGWFIQRRVFQRHDREDCEHLDPDAVILLRRERELRLRFGVLTLQKCAWPASLSEPTPASPDEPVSNIVLPPPCEQFMLELDRPQPVVRIHVTAKASFAVAFREGKAVAAKGPLEGTASYELRAAGIDAAAVYTLAPTALSFCIEVWELGEEEKEWQDVPFIVKNLQLPLQELMPSLTNPAEEFAEGKSRLLPGESLDEAEFKRLAESIRAGVKRAGPPRSLDLVLLLREELEADFEEALALDPIRMLLSHPKWRRVLGFSWFDRDPALVPGQVYEYRLTGFFPAEDLADALYGFHTIPSRTLLPADFFLGSLRFRLPQPARVELAPQTPDSGQVQISRRGIALKAQNEPFWLLPSLEDYSLVVDFPSPVRSVILELHAGHELEFSAGDPGDFGGPLTPVPAGGQVRLDFPAPVQQLLLKGSGFLFALRLPAGPTGRQPASIVLPPVALLNTPRPEPPLFASISNLQLPLPAEENDTPPEVMPQRHALGFDVRWRPAASAGLAVWPAGLQAAPPLDAAVFQIEHRQEPAAGWTPVLPEENWTLGERNDLPRTTHIYPGADLMSLFPEIAGRPAGAGLDFYWRDIFDFDEAGDQILRPLPQPGTLHQYRVRSVDAIGRPSLSWRETGLLRLEKHVPPPVPAGPLEPPAEAPLTPAPSGVQARVLVRGAPDLTTEELALLGDDQNAILLRWGWHAQQRELDPFTKEFRIYAAGPLDSVPGVLQSVATLETGPVAVYEVTLQMERPVAAEAAKGLSLEAGYPFYIRTHTGGTLIMAILETRLPMPGGLFRKPAPGPVRLPVRMTPHLTRPPAWSQRVEVQPVTGAESYQAVLRNRLALSEDHPVDSAWVGVSAADDQFYVPDQLAPLETRPGNESAIVPVLCQGRYQGRPDFDVPPPLEPVPVYKTPEPAGQPVFFRLDLEPYLQGSGLAATDLIFPERASVAAVFAALALTEDGRVMGRVLEPPRPGETEQEIAIGNPDDRAAIVAALQGADTAALEDRYLVFLAGAHPYRDRLFEPAVQDPVIFASFQETLPASASRYVYRVRKSDRAGHLSAGGAMAKVVVRVPSLMPGPAPDRLPPEPGDAPNQLRLRLASDAELAHLLSFSQVITDGGGPLAEAELLRVPNRPDLYPQGGIWLRPPGGALLAPLAKPLSDADVIVDAGGFRRVVLDFAAAPGQRLRVWACTLTRDGIPSLAGGPWSLVMPPPPLPVPVLAVSGSAGNLHFTWTWEDPAAPRFEVAIERSADGARWERISPLLGPSIASFAYLQPPGAWQYRLRVVDPQGRTANGLPVVPS